MDGRKANNDISSAADIRLIKYEGAKGYWPNIGSQHRADEFADIGLMKDQYIFTIRVVFEASDGSVT